MERIGFVLITKDYDNRIRSETKNQEDVMIEKVGESAVIRGRTFELRISPAENFERMYEEYNKFKQIGDLREMVLKLQRDVNDLRSELHTKKNAKRDHIQHEQ